MTAGTIDRLLCELSLYGGGLPLSTRAGGLDPDDPDIGRYVAVYKHPDIGWRIAREFAKREIDFPAALTGGDYWVYRAYLHIRWPGRYRDPRITAARAILQPDMSHMRSLLVGHLVARNSGIDKTAAALGVDPQIVSAYESLFFNVYDRVGDAAYIAHKVYPEGRLVELFEDYIEHEQLGAIMARAGYNNGVEDVAYLGGLGPAKLVTEAASWTDTPSRFESYVMATGFVAARNGWAAQGRHGRAVYSARQILQAAKQSGETSEPYSPINMLTGFVTTQLSRYVEDTRLKVAETRRDAALGLPAAG